MSDAELGYMPATRMAHAIATRKLSPVEAVGAVARRIERLEPRLNAFAALDLDRAAAQAREAEKSVTSGRALGVLHGVPITIKDLTWTKDFPTQFGSRTAKGNRVATDSPLVTRLEAAGAIVLGKTTTPEFGWTGVSRSPLTGITSNPWKQGYNAGASSAGAAVGAAAGYGPLHQGSDGAGSVRMPAHFSGVYGLKPSFGRVPYAPVGTGDYTSHVGPLTRGVADAALMLSVMAGPHEEDFTTLEKPPADYLGGLEDGIAGARIAYSPDLGHARVDPEVADLVRAAADNFARALGTELREARIEWGRESSELARIFWCAHSARHVPTLARWEAEMDPGLVACVKEGARISITDYHLARERKYKMIAAIHRGFRDYDFLITPSVSVAAFPAERLIPGHWPQHDWDWLQWAEFSHPFNMSWNPAASLPCGFTREGLPVGLQIVGRRFDDLGVLRASRAFERALPWAQHRPALD